MLSPRVRSAETCTIILYSISPNSRILYLTGNVSLPPQKYIKKRSKEVSRYNLLFPATSGDMRGSLEDCRLIP